ncbi:hypothetical protein [Streptomyces liangshanensis]|uniref:Uncharacterized protein n=1 Tax=Streptomyces liangshanensis TaxID=2717324 RepID=A0A6G9H4J5_9ACTN|nr:hypothetical protein [Streptomyces liangshanensis]QIQ05151.1 hypothetical protein HA039_25305 [Streptomyces liangshanensis]
MAKDSVPFENPLSTVPAGSEDDGTLAGLREDCARMASHWTAGSAGTRAPVPPSLIRGVTVPPGSARLLDGMSEYGDC